jgi:hypothetical protein
MKKSILAGIAAIGLTGVTTLGAELSHAGRVCAAVGRFGFLSLGYGGDLHQGNPAGSLRSALTQVRLRREGKQTRKAQRKNKVDL